MVAIYEGRYGRVDSTFWGGFRFTLPNGRIVKPTPFMKQLLPHADAILKGAGKNIRTMPDVAEGYFSFFLELAASPPNGWHHAAVAQMSDDELLGHLLPRDVEIGWTASFHPPRQNG